MGKPTPILLSRRPGGGVLICQGRSYVQMSREEAEQLLDDLDHLLDNE